jgi:nuclear transport factor 2 (NTF2) superfamily protein
MTIQFASYLEGRSEPHLVGDNPKSHRNAVASLSRELHLNLTKQTKRKFMIGQQTNVLEPKTQTEIATRPPLPPFTRETAIQKVRLAEDGWNSRDPEKVALAYTMDSRWRNRAEFANGRGEIIALLTRKWSKELDYRLIKELWAFTGNRIAVRFAYECRDDYSNWFRSYGNENWEFDEHGLMQRRFACINDLSIKESERRFHWPQGRRPDAHPGLSDLGM